MVKHKSKSHNTLRKFLGGTRLQQLKVSCAKRVRAYTLQAIPPICKRDFFSVKVVILTCLWHFVYQATSKKIEQLSRSFNWLQIFFWPNVKEAVILIHAIDHSRSLLATADGCCKNLHEKLRSVLWLEEFNLYLTSPANQSIIRGLWEAPGTKAPRTKAPGHIFFSYSSF